MNDQAIPVELFLWSVRRWAEDAVARSVLPATDYDIVTILSVLDSGVIEHCEEDLVQRRSLSVSKLNGVERFAKSYCSLLLRGMNLPVLEEFRAHEQMERQISANKVLLILLMKIGGVRIEA